MDIRSRWIAGNTEFNRYSHTGPRCKAVSS
jgi:hypothetical protein